MEDLAASLFVIAVTGVVVIGIFWYTSRSKSRKESKIRQMAEARKWEFTPFKESLSWGYQLKSPDWTVEALSRSSVQPSDTGSSNIEKTTLWKTRLLADPERRVIIGPRMAQNLPGEMGAALMRQALHLFLGDQADGLQEVQLRNAALSQRFMVFASHPEDAERLLTPIGQKQLSIWKLAPPVIKQSTQGLEIKLQGVHLENPNEILDLVQLGESLING